MLTSKLGDTWDTQSWLLGLFLGNFAGLLLLCGGNSTSRRFIETAFPYSAFGYYTGDFCTLLALVLGALIFPDVLTATSKRSYMNWGLFSLCLLALWIIAGAIVAHLTSALFDPVWALPLLVFVSWVSVCGPISLFRFLRRKHRRLDASQSRPTSKSLFARLAGLCALIAVSFALTILGAYNFKHPSHFDVDMQVHWPPSKEVRVPLSKIGTGIYVRVWLNGQEVSGKVDTGSDRVEWPRSLHIEGRPTSRQGQSLDILCGKSETRIVVLPRFKIGGYEITNLPIEMSQTSYGPFSRPSEAGGKEVLLGNPAFVEAVLTIDYKNSVMVIRPPQYDFTRQRRRSGDRVLEMGWTTLASDEKWESQLYGTPSIQAAIEGTSFWCTLDTGAGGPDICLTQHLVDRHPNWVYSKPDTSWLNATDSSARVTRIHALDVNFPCLALPPSKSISLGLNGVVTPLLSTNAPDGEGVIGLPLMEQYRITIDYQRGRVLLEPYAQDVPRKKQEKQRPVAKLPLL